MRSIYLPARRAGEDVVTEGDVTRTPAVTAARRSRGARVALAVCLALVTTGCGYSLAGRGSFLPADLRTVGIPVIQNRTPFLQVEQTLTEKVRGEFIGRGKYEVLPQEAGADAVLSAQITSMSVQPVGFTDQQLASRYLITLTMSGTFTDTRSGEVLWSNEALTYRSEYELSTRGTTALSGAEFVDQERSSLERIGTDVARSVVTAILEAF
jgi:hypothetical protein